MHSTIDTIALSQRFQAANADPLFQVATTEAAVGAGTRRPATIDRQIMTFGQFAKFL